MRVRAKQDCYVQLAFRKEGEVFEYNGPPNVVLEAVKRQKGEPEEDAAPMSMEALTGAPRPDVIRNPMGEEEPQKTKRPRNRIRLQSRPVEDSVVGQPE